MAFKISLSQVRLSYYPLLSCINLGKLNISQLFFLQCKNEDNMPTLAEGLNKQGTYRAYFFLTSYRRKISVLKNKNNYFYDFRKVTFLLCISFLFFQLTIIAFSTYVQN